MKVDDAEKVQLHLHLDEIGFRRSRSFDSSGLIAHSDRND